MMRKKRSAGKIVRDIYRATREYYSTEESAGKIALEGLWRLESRRGRGCSCSDRDRHLYDAGEKWILD
jgi:hypothetical protein